MRPAALLAPVVLCLLAVLPAVSAQDDCTQQASACPAVISVDEHGFTDVSQSFFTQNEWYTITFSNEDANATHTVAFDQYQTVNLAASADQDVTLQMTKLGCFTVKDSVSGATVQVGVVAGDSVSVSPSHDPCHGASGLSGSGSGASSSKARAPGFELPLLAIALVAVLLAVRRRAQ